MKNETKLRHWLHIVLTLLTGGLWLAVYGLLLAINEMNNRVVRGYNQGRADGIRYITEMPPGRLNAVNSLREGLARVATVDVSKSQRSYTGLASAGIPQAAMTPWEADLYNRYRSEIEEGRALHPVDQAMYEDLRSRFK